MSMNLSCVKEPIFTILCISKLQTNSRISAPKLVLEASDDSSSQKTVNSSKAKWRFRKHSISLLHNRVSTSTSQNWPQIMLRTNWKIHLRCRIFSKCWTSIWAMVMIRNLNRWLSSLQSKRMQVSISKSKNSWKLSNNWKILSMTSKIWQTR